MKNIKWKNVILFASVLLIILIVPNLNKINFFRKSTPLNDEMERHNKEVQASIKELDAMFERERQRDSLENIYDAEFEKTKAAKIRKKHPEWSKEECTRLSNNEIWIGMSIHMIVYKRGLPTSANPSNYGNGTRWQWCWYGSTPSCFYDENNDGLIDSYN